MTQRRPNLLPQPVPQRTASGSRELLDSSEAFLPALDWLGGSGGDAAGNAERRAEDLVGINRGVLRDLNVELSVGRVRGVPGLHARTGIRVGAVPLRSPVSGRADFGLVVSPRFGWTGIGDVLGRTGFRVTPDLLPLPDLPQSERHVPPWVLSSVVLLRIRRLLDATHRRFETVYEDRHAPRGAVDWGSYATRRLPVGRALSVPCRYPDLRDDEQLRSAIHWTVRRHRASLLAAPEGGLVVRQLLELCEQLIARVSGTPPQAPDARTRAAWRTSTMGGDVFKLGVDAIGWTVDERGLAGLSSLSGLAWRMNMDSFFEGWVETLAAWAARRTGANVASGRTEATRVPLDWDQNHKGSQRSLLPDVVIQRPDVVVVLDAKYKRHAQEIERRGWRNIQEETLREQHRSDVLQALAYSTLFDAPRVVAVLAYPCDLNAWHSLAHRDRVLARARLRTSPRNVELALLAVPIGSDPKLAGEYIAALVADPVQG